MPEPRTVLVDNHAYSQRYGSARDAIDALRPYAASQSVLGQWAGELVSYFSVVSPGARVIAWRIGGRYVIQERQ